MLVTSGSDSIFSAWVAESFVVLLFGKVMVEHAAAKQTLAKKEPNMEAIESMTKTIPKHFFLTFLTSFFKMFI